MFFKKIIQTFCIGFFSLGLVFASNENKVDDTVTEPAKEVSEQGAPKHPIIKRVINPHDFDSLFITIGFEKTKELANQEAWEKLFALFIKCAISCKGDQFSDAISGEQKEYLIDFLNKAFSFANDQESIKTALLIGVKPKKEKLVTVEEKKFVTKSDN